MRHKSWLALFALVPLLLAGLVVPASASVQDEMVLTTDRSLSAAVTYRNPNAQWQHSLDLVEPREVAICAPCGAGEGRVGLGDFQVGDHLVMRLTVNAYGQSYEYFSDDSSRATVTTLADGWEVIWEDGGGPPADLTVQVVASEVQNPPPAGPGRVQWTGDWSSHWLLPVVGSRRVELGAASTIDEPIIISTEGPLPPEVTCEGLHVPATRPLVTCDLRRVMGAYGDDFVITASAASGSIRQPVRVTLPRYVAMGDSYHSGEGAAPFEYGTNGERGSNYCHRSLGAAARRLAADPGGGAPPLPLRHVACSGAKIVDLTETNAGSGELAQIGALGWDVGLVTMSIGGNDAGFAPLMTAASVCPLDPTFRCYDEHEVLAAVFALDDGARKLETAIRRVAALAPNATVLVNGYPRLFKADDWRRPCGSVSRPTAEFVNKAVLAGNDVIQRVVGRIRMSGVDVRYVDQAAAFRSHELCATGTDWINGIVLGRAPREVSLNPFRTVGAWNKNAIQLSYHPNAAGQIGLADAMRRVLVR